MFWRVLCLPLSLSHLSRLLPPGSPGEVWQPRNTAESGNGGLAPGPHSTNSQWGWGQRAPATAPPPLSSVFVIGCCGDLWPFGFDFLTKPPGPQVATAVLGQRARPKLTQRRMLQILTKKERPVVSFFCKCNKLELINETDIPNNFHLANNPGVIRMLSGVLVKKAELE